MGWSTVLTKANPLFSWSCPLQHVAHMWSKLIGPAQMPHHIHETQEISWPRNRPWMGELVASSCQYRSHCHIFGATCLVILLRFTWIRSAITNKEPLLPVQSPPKSLPISLKSNFNNTCIYHIVSEYVSVLKMKMSCQSAVSVARILTPCPSTPPRGFSHHVLLVVGPQAPVRSKINMPYTLSINSRPCPKIWFLV